RELLLEHLLARELALERLQHLPGLGVRDRDAPLLRLVEQELVGDDAVQDLAIERRAQGHLDALRPGELHTHLLRVRLQLLFLDLLAVAPGDHGRELARISRRAGLGRLAGSGARSRSLSAGDGGSRRAGSGSGRSRSWCPALGLILGLGLGRLLLAVAAGEPEREKGEGEKEGEMVAWSHG